MSLAERTREHPGSASLADTYELKVPTEVNPRYLQTPDAQVDIVSRLQPGHYSRRLTGKDKPWMLTENPPTEDTPYWQGHRVPDGLHEKSFNAYGAPGKYLTERAPEALARTAPRLYRGERRIYTMDDKWSREMKEKKFAKQDQIYALKPHSEKYCSKVIPDRHPSENAHEKLWAPTKTGELESISRTKYGLYTGRFDKPGTKSRQWWIKTGRIPDEEDERFPELQPDPRPRWGYVSKATIKANDEARAVAASQRNFDTMRPRNTWSCPEMGYYFTHR